jgi:serine/threonine-protein kinase TNNI3K
LDEKIGQGTTADIYRGAWRGFDVAVKCISPEFFRTNANGVEFFAQEVETLSKQRHRFVLNLMGACLNPPNHAWVVTEYLNTTLKEWLHGPGKRYYYTIQINRIHQCNTNFKSLKYRNMNLRTNLLHPY